jgi:hypothetical protein
VREYGCIPPVDGLARVFSQKDPHIDDVPCVLVEPVLDVEDPPAWEMTFVSDMLATPDLLQMLDVEP